MEKLEYSQITAQLSPKQVELYDTYLYLLNADERIAEKNRYKEHITIIESLATERIQKAALLAACELAQDQAERASLVQDRSVTLIKAICAIIAENLESAIKAGEA